VPAPEPWPDLSDAALNGTLEGVGAALDGRHGTPRPLCSHGPGQCPALSPVYAQNSILEREAPTHFVVPSGSRLPIDYMDGDVPTLSVRLQEMFGMSQTPSVAAGRLPLLLKLLSPAGDRCKSPATSSAFGIAAITRSKRT
jgi:ATP-dependent helicase HrpB